MAPGDKDDKDEDPEPIPRLPRGRLGFKLPGGQLMAIFTLLVTLFAVLALRQGCADGVANFFRAFDPPPDAAAPGQSAPTKH